MWRLLRPDAVNVLESDSVKKALSKYRKILVKKTKARFQIAKEKGILEKRVEKAYKIQLDYLRNFICLKALPMGNVKIPALDVAGNLFSIPFEKKVLNSPHTKPKIQYDFAKKISPELSKIPYARTRFPINYPMIFHRFGHILNTGSKIFMRKFRNFTKLPINCAYGPDIDNLIRLNKKNKNYVKTLLFEEDEYFNPIYIKELLKNHFMYVDNGEKLCAILTFKLFLKNFF